MKAPERANMPLHFRLREAEARRLDALCARFRVPKASIARRALELGMAVLEVNPAEFAAAPENES
jgi:predicted DNA-binding protein